MSCRRLHLLTPFAATRHVAIYALMLMLMLPPPDVCYLLAVCAKIFRRHAAVAIYRRRFHISTVYHF